MACAKSRHMCSGCICKGTCQRKVATLETEMLEANTSNLVLAPLLTFITTPISIKKFRQSLKHLPMMNYKKRDDSIFGAARYLANTLGIQIKNATTGTIDEVMSASQIKEKWRQATFSCKCSTSHGQQTFENRAFCEKCSFIIYHNSVPDIQRCPGCLINDSWENIGQSCLACQFATIIYRNRFVDRFQKYLEIWLPPLETDTDDDNTAYYKSTPRAVC
jgi:hypothetical protein